MNPRALLLCLLGAPALAAPPPEIAVDPRLELLGVIQHLAWAPPGAPADPYLAQVEKRFAAFRDHPAVSLYARAVRQAPDAYGILLLYYGPPPELRLQKHWIHLPYLDAEAATGLGQRFLWELRDFAAASDFMSFFREQRPLYRGLERRARKALGGLNPVAEIEDYLGLSLDARTHYYLSKIYRTSLHNSFILPYPDPRSLARLDSPFDVYTLCLAEPSVATWPGMTVFGPTAPVLWQELLYVFVDPAQYYFELANVEDPRKFYGPQLAACRTDDANCVKGLVVAALVDRLSWRTRRARALEGVARAELVAALSERLAIYESRGENAGNLWDFYPELLSVLAEKAGRKPAAFQLRPRRISRVSDFWNP